MAWVDFYVQSTASNLNAGSTTADSAVYTSTAGNFDGTSVFTPTDGSTPASSISVGDYVALYNTGDAAARCVAKVTAVGAGVNGTVTIDTTLKYGTVPTSNSGSRALKAGGAWADQGITATNAAMNTGTAPQSTRVNIKAGTYANTTTSRTFNLGGATTTPLWWRGYKTTPGDQDSNNVAVAGTDIPSITFTTGSISTTGAHLIFSNLAVSGAPSGALWTANSGSNPCTFYRVRIESTSSNAATQALNCAATNFTAVACYFKTPGTANKTVNLTTTSYWVGCSFVGGIVGLLSTSNTANIDFCIFDSQAGDAIQFTTGAANITNTSIYAAQGNGVVWSGTPGASLVANCYFESINQASKAAINNNSGTNTNLVRAVANTYYNCTANTSGLSETFLIFDNGTLGAAAFTNPGSQDFSIGTVAKALGFPGKFENTAVYQGYLDAGAVQRQEPAGGGNNIFIVEA